MRRSDREITDENTIKNFIENESIIRIAFCDDGDIYIVPVNYGHCMEDNHFLYFHYLLSQCSHLNADGVQLYFFRKHRLK